MKFYYIRNPQKNRDITIVSNIINENDYHYVEFGFTLRNNHDIFKKREGRHFAEQRLYKKDEKFSGKLKIEHIKHKEIMFSILNNILINPHVPKKFIPDIENSIKYLNEAH
jgi:hypothetical protein